MTVQERPSPQTESPKTGFVLSDNSEDDDNPIAFMGRQTLVTPRAVTIS